MFCPVDQVLEITGAFFGDTEGRHRCELPVQDEDEAYYGDIVERCEGRQSCEDLQVNTDGEMWCPGSIMFADSINYVKLQYQCRDILGELLIQCTYVYMCTSISFVLNKLYEDNLIQS